MINKVLAVSYVAGARGDFLARILKSRVSYSSFSSFPYRHIVTTMRTNDYFKIHPNLTCYELVNLPRHLIELEKYKNDPEIFLRQCKKANVFTVRIHTDFDFQLLQNIRALQKEKYAAVVGALSYDSILRNEQFDAKHLDLFDAIVDFRDLWNIDGIQNVCKLIRGDALTDLEITLIKKNLSSQPALDHVVNYKSYSHLNA